MSGEMFVLTMPICARCGERMQNGECYMLFKPKRYFHVGCYDEGREERGMSGEQWRIDLSDEHVYRIDAVKDDRIETVCEFKRDSAGADARRITDAFERVEAQDEEIERLKKSQAEVEERALALLYCLDARDEAESSEDAVLELRKALSRVLVDQQRGK